MRPVLRCRPRAEGHHLHDIPMLPVWSIANHLLEGRERTARLEFLSGDRLGRIAQEHSRVGQAHPGDTVFVLAENPQADDPAPVLQDEGDVREVKHIDQCRANPFDVARHRVIAHFGGFVRTAEPDQIDGDRPTTRSRHRGDDVAPTVRPRWITVNENDRRAISRPLVDVVDPKCSAVLIGSRIAGRGNPLWKILKFH